MPFLAVLAIFAYFLWEKGPKFFLGSKNFFSKKFDPQWFQIHVFEIPNSFWLIMPYFLVMLKKRFPLFSNINWDFPKYPLLHNLKKKHSGPVFRSWEHPKP